MLPCPATALGEEMPLAPEAIFAYCTREGCAPLFSSLNSLFAGLEALPLSKPSSTMSTIGYDDGVVGKPRPASHARYPWADGCVRPALRFPATIWSWRSHERVGATYGATHPTPGSPAIPGSWAPGTARRTLRYLPPRASRGGEISSAAAAASRSASARAPGP